MAGYRKEENVRISENYIYPLFQVNTFTTANTLGYKIHLTHKKIIHII